MSCCVTGRSEQASAFGEGQCAAEWPLVGPHDPRMPTAGFDPIVAVRGPAGERPLLRFPDVPINQLELDSGEDAACKPGEVHLMMARLMRSVQEFEPFVSTFKHRNPSPYVVR